MSDCNSPKRTLGITLYPPSIGVPCDCYDEVIYPIPANLLLKAFPSSAIKSAGIRLFPSLVKSVRVSGLRAKLAPILEKIEKINISVDLIDIEIEARLADLNRWQQILRDKISNSNWKINKKSIMWSELSTARIELKQALDQLEVLKSQGISSPPLSYDDYINDPRISGPGSIGEVIDRYMGGSNPLVVINQNTGKIVGGSLYLDWLQAVKESDDAKNLLEDAQKLYFPLIESNQQKIRQQNKELSRLVLERDESLVEKNNLDSLISKADTTDPEVFGDLVDSLTIGGAVAIGVLLIEAITDALSAFSFVEKRSCDSTATLNQDTCMCECASDQESCIPVPLGGITSYLPKPPGTRTHDELITCHPKCCGGQIWREATPQLIGYIGCECYCPNIPGPGNEQQELKPCSDSNKTDCSDGMICAQKYPPDIDPNAWFPPPSKYIWSSTECEWVCKDGDCPDGQYRGPGCKCICKSAEDAGCFSPYTWRTTSDANTGEAISCECLCLSPSELCGGECYEQCANGKVRNPSTCSCECPAGKEPCNNGCYDPCPPNSTREIDCSCSPYLPFMFSSETVTIDW